MRTFYDLDYGRIELSRREVGGGYGVRGPLPLENVRREVGQRRVGHLRLRSEFPLFHSLMG